jgi:hypothetical protein
VIGGTQFPVRRPAGTGSIAPTLDIVQFSRDLREGVMSGQITVSFRLWRQAKVRAGNRYSVGPAQIEIDAIELMPFSAITVDDLRQTGEPDLGALRERAAHAGPISDDTLLFRVQFHVVDTEPDG